MANEPERPIEKLLRAAAKKRRDEAGAPFELHPANRRLLQGEVARMFANAGRQTRTLAELLGRLWPRFAWGVAIFAVLAVAAYVLLPFPGKGKPEALLARNEPTPQAAPAKRPPSPAPAMEPAAPAPIVLEAKANPTADTFANAPQPAPASAARQLGVERHPLAADSLSPQTESEAREQLIAPAASPTANRDNAAEGMITASGGTAAQPPAEIANGAFDRRFGLAGNPSAPANMPAVAAAPPPVAMTAPPASAVTADEARKLADEKAAGTVLAYQSAAAMPSGGAVNSATAPTYLFKSISGGRHEAKDVAVAQWFSQVAPGGKTKAALTDNSTAIHRVLASFQVEQAGPELRIVDGDGSVYCGYVRLAGTARRQRSAEAEASAVTAASGVTRAALEEKPAASLEADQLPPPNYFFRVAGTNRSLHEKVVFTGNLIAATNSPSFPQGTNFLRLGSDLSGSQIGAAQPKLLLLLNSRISGKLIIGNSKPVEINALPTSP